ncbi:MAG: alpha/beta fold hydrolase [Thermodesulfobacteriota bacterium]|nr:alpha/beta fold hydrolase [Thermodesulfobacteriota bacterium]
MNTIHKKTLHFEADGLVLTGVLHLPDKRPAPFVVGCHGLFADKDSSKQIALADRCAGAGLAYFRFDHRGCGQSQGNFAAETSLDARCRDLASAIAAVRDNPDTDRLTGLFGSSMGGAVVIASAGGYKAIKTVTIAAPLISEPVAAAIRTSGESMAEKMPDGFYDRALRFDISDKAAGLSNILLFHGEDDTVVPCDHATQIYALCKQPKELVIQKGGDHRMSAPRHQAAFMEKAVAWMEGNQDNVRD